jgi:hypothetical protein
MQVFHVYHYTPINVLDTWSMEQSHCRGCKSLAFAALQPSSSAKANSLLLSSPWISLLTSKYLLYACNPSSDLPIKTRISSRSSAGKLTIVPRLKKRTMNLEWRSYYRKNLCHILKSKQMKNK